jgi:hypothetical protein
MACDADTLLTAACESQIGCITSDITLLIITAQLLCEINEGGGGGGGGGQYVFEGNYGGGVPTDSPTVSAAIAFDTSTGTQWNWYSNAWH